MNLEHLKEVVAKVRIAEELERLKCSEEQRYT